MDWFAAFVKRANANSALTTLLGGQKVYSEDAPQGAVRPYVTLFDVTEQRPQILGGYDLEFARVQIDVWTDSYGSKNPIMDAALNALVPGNTSNGHTFQRAEIALGPRDVGGEREGDKKVYRKSADLIVAHS
jgi:hypothetical protein